MNTAITLGVSLVGVVALTLGFFVALRAKRRFGFLAPLGFLCAALLNRICFLASISLIKHSVSDANKGRLHEVASKLSSDDLAFYLGIKSHADGIWFLGAILFLCCGWLDMKAAGTPSSKKTRLVLIMGGSLLVAVSAVYPVWISSLFW